MMDKPADTLAMRQGRARRALALAVLPISTAGMALWIGAVAARGGNPLDGFGTVGAADIIAMVLVAFLCRMSAGRRTTPAAPPAPLQIVFGLIVVLAWASLIACVLAAANGCGKHACDDTAGYMVDTGIVFGVFAVAASIFTIRFMRQPMLPN